MHLLYVQISPSDLGPTADATEGAETGVSLQTGVVICVMTRNLSEDFTHVYYLFLPIWAFPFSLCKRTWRSPFPF